MNDVLRGYVCFLPPLSVTAAPKKIANSTASRIHTLDIHGKSMSWSPDGESQLFPKKHMVPILT